jgi:hypothetical protein
VPRPKAADGRWGDFASAAALLLLLSCHFSARIWVSFFFFVLAGPQAACPNEIFPHR